MWQVLVVPSSQPRNNAYVIVPLFVTAVGVDITNLS